MVSKLEIEQVRISVAKAASLAWPSFGVPILGGPVLGDVSVAPVDVV